MTAAGPVPLVSVILLTYNHEPFLPQALDSVLRQRTSFGVEVLVSEDCSTDGTRAVVERCAAAHPGTVRVFLSPRNQNDNDVFLRAYRAARGEFVAYLDGDDYWTDETKLQMQVDFLRAHPRASACFHAVEVVEVDGTPRRRAGFDGRWLSTDGLLAGNPVKSPSPLFRRAALGELPAWFERAPFIDWPLYVWASRSGDIGYLDTSLAAYRKHTGGHWSGMAPSGQAEAFLAHYRLVLPCLSRRDRRRARPWIGGAWVELALARAVTGQRAAGWRALGRSLVLAPLAPRSARRPPARRAPRARAVAHLLGPRAQRALEAVKGLVLSRRSAGSR